MPQLFFLDSNEIKRRANEDFSLLLTPCDLVFFQTFRSNLKNVSNYARICRAAKSVKIVLDNN